MAANVHKLSGSWVLLEVATISQILVGRSNDERKHRDHYQTAHSVTYPSSGGTAPLTHRSSPFSFNGFYCGRVQGLEQGALGAK